MERIALIDRALHVLESLSHGHGRLIEMAGVKELAVVLRCGVVGLTESVLFIIQHLVGLLMLRCIPGRKAAKL